MDLIEKNKALILQYYRAISGVHKSTKLLKKYISDPELISHIQAVDEILHDFEEVIDEMTGEENRVIVRTTCKGQFLKRVDQEKAYYKNVEFPVAVGYYIEHGKIIDHWMISDHMSLLEQLGWLENGVSTPG